MMIMIMMIMIMHDGNDDDDDNNVSLFSRRLSRPMDFGLYFISSWLYFLVRFTFSTSFWLWWHYRTNKNWLI